MEPIKHVLLRPTLSLEEAEKAAIVRAFAETKNKALVARLLGISRAHLYRLMEKYGIDPGTQGTLFQEDPTRIT